MSTLCEEKMIVHTYSLPHGLVRYKKPTRSKPIKNFGIGNNAFQTIDEQRNNSIGFKGHKFNNKDNHNILDCSTGTINKSFGYKTEFIFKNPFKNSLLKDQITNLEKIKNLISLTKNPIKVNMKLFANSKKKKIK